MISYTSLVCIAACVVFSTPSNGQFPQRFPQFGRNQYGLPQYNGAYRTPQNGGYGQYGAQPNGGYGGYGGQQNGFHSEMVAVNGSSVWINYPVNGSLPTFSRNLGNNTNGETVTEFCQYVVQNNALPFALPSPSDLYGATTNSNGRPMYIPSVEKFVEKCGQMLKDGGIFPMPSDIYNQLRKANIM